MRLWVLVLLSTCLATVLAESKEEGQECGRSRERYCVYTKDECPGRIKRRLSCGDGRQMCCQVGRKGRERNTKGEGEDEEDSSSIEAVDKLGACKKRSICKQIKGKCKKKTKKCKGQAFWGPELCDPSEDCNCCVKKNKLCRNKKTCDLNKGNCQFYFEPCLGIQIPNACKGKNKKACACCAACEIEKSCLKQGGVCYNSAAQCLGIVVEKGCKGPNCVCCIPPPLVQPGPPGTNETQQTIPSANTSSIPIQEEPDAGSEPTDLAGPNASNSEDPAASDNPNEAPRAF